jgi:hypothetical protein
MVAFLVLAVGITQMRAIVDSLGVVTGLSWSDVSGDIEYGAEVPLLPDTRADKLEHLREKIAQRLSLGTAPVVFSEGSPATSSPEVAVITSTSTPAVININECPGYSPLNVFWSPQLIAQENVEGMRIYSQPGESTMDATGVMVPTQNVRVKFPLRSWPLSSSSCIPYDVIGIAMDGSLIRNNEVALYAVFGGNTLVGYALDGFPIYGADSKIKTDACGGAVVEGAYRYVIEASRPGIILCYAGAPASIQ